jgi:hypothetical protein
MLNPFFTQGTRSEQSLVQDLINEQLRMYGVEVYYLPRKYITENTIIREVVQSKFDEAHPLEAYVNNYEEYEGAGTLLSKFGIEAKEEIRLTISRERYENYIAPLLKGKDNIKLSKRPKTGDLIWFPLDDRIYEIKDIERAKPYYQLQNLYVYELYCELFRYQDEVIDTGVLDIDNELIGDETDGINDDGFDTVQGNTQTLTVVGTAVTATATITGLIDGAIQFINVTNRGGGYLTTPTVAISSAPSGGTTGIATAVMIGGIEVCNLNVNPSAQSVQAVNLINPGSGYTVAPSVRFISETGTGAAATTGISTDAIGIVSITSGGGGYVNPPTITFTNEVFKTGVTTVGAAATAVVSAAGTISNIYITNAGAGYSTAPDIVIAGVANTTNSSGDFVFNELITGQTSGTTARVRVWDAESRTLEIATVSGIFVRGETIIGATSGAIHVISKVNNEVNDDGFADNINIEAEADSILDFSEKNPFGIP